MPYRGIFGRDWDGGHVHGVEPESHGFKNLSSQCRWPVGRRVSGAEVDVMNGHLA
jgi:hypothetical protein